MTKTERLEKEMGIKMVAPFSVGDKVVIGVNTKSGPDFVSYKLIVPIQMQKWWAVVSDEDTHRVSEDAKSLDIEELDIQDFTDTAELEATTLHKAPVHRSYAQDWDVF